MDNSGNKISMGKQREWERDENRDKDRDKNTDRDKQKIEGRKEASVTLLLNYNLAYHPNKLHLFVFTS